MASSLQAYEITLAITVSNVLVAAEPRLRLN